MSDLADSSGIEKDANMICFLWNQDDKTNEDGSLKYTNSNNQVVKFNCIKNRNGRTFSAIIMFKKNIQKFVDITINKGNI
jgi:replicative DNA helicase